MLHQKAGFFSLKVSRVVTCKFFTDGIHSHLCFIVKLFAKNLHDSPKQSCNVLKLQVHFEKNCLGKNFFGCIFYRKSSTFFSGICELILSSCSSVLPLKKSQRQPWKRKFLKEISYQCLIASLLRKN